MDIIKKDKPWENLRIYRLNKMIDLFELESKNSNHIISDEEIKLHEYRNKISYYEKNIKNGKNWEYYKKIVNPYELVYTQKKYKEFPESLCLLKPLSRSYFKMIEILEVINFFKDIKTQNIRTAHVCEGPGGFIEALFEEASRNKKTIQTTVAMTLKSKQINIPGWKRATNFLQRNKTIRILYGQDETGDIIKPENQQYFIDYCINPEYGGKMNIFTADGGFDFSCDYAKQEKMIFPLLLASTKIGFEVLKKGGVFVLKVFDFYEKETVDLLYFLSCHFKEWTLYKPAMSRPCNPEQYFVGKGFIGCSDEELDIMRLWCNMLNNKQVIESLFKIELPIDFLNNLNELRTNSFKRQTEYLEKVFNIIEKDDEKLINRYLIDNEKSSLEWCLKFKVPILPNRRLAEDLQIYQLISSQ